MKRTCPCCGGKLRKIKFYGYGNLASKYVLECVNCYGTFPLTSK